MSEICVERIIHVGLLLNHHIPLNVSIAFTVYRQIEGNGNKIVGTTLIVAA